MQSTEITSPRIAVIGGGAAGLLAAGTACQNGANVTVFEQNPRPGKKILITGKGRCNVTNDCSASDFLQSVTRNPKFLYSAIYAFPPSATMRLLEELDVPLKTERGNRVFPVSDKAAHVADALIRHARNAKFIHDRVTCIKKEEDGSFTVVTVAKSLGFDAVIIATGGKSYPGTGSDGSGYGLARALGHTVTPLVPSLVPIESPDPICSRLMGLSLRNIALKIRHRENGKVLYSDFGELLFTHFGLSGPTILSASAHLRDASISELYAEIDLKPALDEKTLDSRLLSDFNKYANRDFVNALGDLLPAKLILPFIARCGIEEHRKVNLITRQERRRILSLLKSFRVDLSDFRPIEEAIVTSGGIKVTEINPKTMESKIHSRLYFAGEILDVDAYTGGFNLQIAFATGYLAAISASAQKSASKQ